VLCYSETGMNTPEIVAALDAEIARLQQARTALAGFEAPRRGRPPAFTMGSMNGTKPRTMSSAGRARIAEAQRKRWAAQKAAANGIEKKK
jgi:hypothetical protein